VAIPLLCPTPTGWKFLRNLLDAGPASASCGEETFFGNRQATIYPREKPKRPLGRAVLGCSPGGAPLFGWR